MKDQTIGQIADKLNISKATVSRAIRHCGDVDSQTRQNVLNEIRFVNYQPVSSCDIYAILPDRPQYFWNEFIIGFRAGRLTYEIQIKCNVYTQLRDENIVLAYLDEAEQLNARTIIISTLVTPKIREKILSMNTGRLIIFLSEYADLPNTFFVGSDSYTDGYEMGKQFLSHYADRPLVALNIPGNPNISHRLDGFCDAVKKQQTDIVIIDIAKHIFKDPKLIPSKIAPLLADFAKQTPAPCIYVPFGLSQLPTICKKAKLNTNTVCMCHDFSLEESTPYVTITSNQDPMSQSLTAVKLGVEYINTHIYPPNKKTWVSSLLEFKNKTDAV